MVYFVAEFYDLLLGVANNHLPRRLRHKIEDVVQDAFVALLRSIENGGLRFLLSYMKTGDAGVLSEPAASRTCWSWLRTVVICRCACVRAENPPGPPLSTLPKEPAVVAEDSAAQNTSELLQDVQQNLWRLSPEHRNVLTMHYLQNMGCQEIADQLDIPLSTVKTRLFRARNELRTLVGDGHPERDATGIPYSREYR